MKNKKNLDCTGTACRKTSIGGQALLEGIMMRGPQKTAMAVRNPENEIVLESWNTEAKKRAKITKLPFFRGVFNLFDSMSLGYKCLMRSAEISGLEDAEAELAANKEAKKREKAAKKASKNAINAVESPENNADAFKAQTDIINDQLEQKSNEAEVLQENCQNKKEESSSLTTGVMIIGLVLGLAIAVLMFVYLPTLISQWILGVNASTEHPILLTVISGGIKIVILVLYMFFVSLMKDIKRTFMYHGAEHKSIFCYERGLELTVENVKKQSRFHPRCGTSFLFLMVFVSVLIMIPISFLLRECLPVAVLDNKWIFTLIRTGIALVLLPLMAGIGYELIKVAGRHDNILTKIISAPGLWMQRITTKEPEDSMIECAITALKAVIPEDESDKW